ncbi:MAG: SDR family NAD(P)-dependent oxidoreductase [Actinomycetota bacterium]|nr:SDR family NAD(P)-dependent oxidoreductase [Actinomycetota bacterium]
MAEAQRVAVITGASAGIGAATALRLSKSGFQVILGARRKERLEEIARDCGGRAVELDVTDEKSIEKLAAGLDRVDVLVNNAGLARGRDHISELSADAARLMWETNVMGLISMTRILLPFIESARGHIVNVGSTAGREAYPGGGGYSSTKHAVRAITQTLRLELVGKPIRITEIAPGLVETEFSMVRFGDETEARKVYAGIEALTADDIADCIDWAVSRPPRVNIDEIVVRPVAQANSTVIARSEPEAPR